MRAFLAPAAYGDHVAAEIARLMHRVANDQACRADEDSRVREFASVPDTALDPDAAGEVVVVVMDRAAWDAIGNRMERGEQGRAA